MNWDSKDEKDPTSYGWSPRADMWEHSQSTGWAVQTPTTVGMALPWVDNTWASLHRNVFFVCFKLFVSCTWIINPMLCRDFSLFIFLSCSLLYVLSVKKWPTETAQIQLEEVVGWQSRQRKSNCKGPGMGACLAYLPETRPGMNKS